MYHFCYISTYFSATEVHFVHCLANAYYKPHAACSVFGSVRHSVCVKNRRSVINR